jgi:hypothetical protein
MNGGRVLEQHGDDLAAEISWLSRIADAYKDSSIVRAIAQDWRPGENLVTDVKERLRDHQQPA